MRGLILDPYRFAAVTPPAIAFGGTGVNTSPLTTYSITGVSIGTASSNRYVVAAICGRTTAGTRTVSSCTIGGVSATFVARINVAASCSLELWIAAVPTGTTATIDITWSGGMANCGVATWALTGLTSSTAVSTATDAVPASNTNDVNLTTAIGDLIVAAAISVNGVDRTFTWVGVTENYDAVVETGDTTHSGGSFTAVAAESPRTINVTRNSSSTDLLAISANWR